MKEISPKPIPDTSVRLKVNNDCQWSCTFCHNEGTEVPENQTKRVSVFLDKRNLDLPPVTEMPFSDEIITQIAEVTKLGIDEVHMTGGEPTLHKGLPGIVRGLREQGLRVKMTTNGQASPGVIEELAEAGVEGMTFSFLSFDPEQFSQTQHIKNLKWAQMMIDRGKRNIILARDLGINVKINTVVLDEDDYPRVDAIREFAEENNIRLILLPSLGEKENSQPAVFDYAEKYGVQVDGFEHTNNGKGSKQYEGENGLVFDAKYTRPYHPDVVCEGCPHNGKDSCYEKFYGVRMEFRDNAPYVRLCIQQTNEKTVMPLQEFIDKGVYAKL